MAQGSTSAQPPAVATRMPVGLSLALYAGPLVFATLIIAALARL